MHNPNAKSFVNQLFMLLKTAQIHDPSNKAFTHPLEQFQGLIGTVIASDGSLTLEAMELSLYLNEEKLRTDISTFASFKYIDELFTTRNINGIRFHGVPTSTELTSLVRVLVRADNETSGAEALNTWAESNEVSSVEFLERVEKKSVASQDLPTKTEHKRRALKNYVKAIDVMKNSAKQIRSSQGLEARRAKRIVYDLVDICLEEGFSFLGLSAIKNYDEYTFNHSVNVCVISIGFGKNLGLSKKQIGELGIAGLYHDFGKLAIPREILNKPGKFDPAEWEVMKTHPLRSIKTLLGMKSFTELDIKKMIAAFEHHRNYDSTGYPQTGLKKPMNFYSRVVAIADAYDAMTTNRVYQRAMLPTMALKILLDNGGTKFDPLLVKAFVNTVGIYPVGSLVRLTDSSLGIVSAVNSDPEMMARPTVKIVANPQGVKIENGPEINLAAPMPGSPLAIDTVLHPEDYHVNVAHYLFGDTPLASPAAN